MTNKKTNWNDRPIHNNGNNQVRSRPATSSLSSTVESSSGPRPSVTARSMRAAQQQHRFKLPVRLEECRSNCDSSSSTLLSERSHVDVSETFYGLQVIKFPLEDVHWRSTQQCPSMGQRGFWAHILFRNKGKELRLYCWSMQVMLDTVGAELQVVNNTEKTLQLQEDGKVILTPDHGQEASSEILPINFS